MRSLLLLPSILVLGFGLAISAAAQKTEDEVSSRLSGQPLLLRGLWAQDSLKFDSHGKPLGNYKTGSFTLAGFELVDAKIERSRLILHGNRVGLQFDEKGKTRRVVLFASGKKDAPPEALTVEIEGKPDADFGSALDVIFVDRLRELVPFMPEYWQPFAQAKILNDGDVQKVQHAEGAAHVGGIVKAPTVRKSKDPKFTEAARRQKLSANTEVYLWVGEDGKPSHIRIVRPVGLGLDDAAVECISQYEFNPATQDGKPVTVDLYMDVNFRIF